MNTLQYRLQECLLVRDSVELQYTEWVTQQTVAGLHVCILSNYIEGKEERRK